MTAHFADKLDLYNIIRVLCIVKEVQKSMNLFKLILISDTLLALGATRFAVMYTF